MKIDKSITDRNTKAQILEAYERLIEQVEARSNDDPKEVQQRRENTEIVKNASGNSDKSISELISKVKTEFIDSLEKIENSLIVERKKLATIQEAITIEEKRLNNLYGLTAGVDSLSAILLAQKEQKEKFDAEMNETKAQWEKEKASFEESIKIEKETTEKLRKREEEEYSYSIQQKRKLEQDEYTLKKMRQEVELKEQRSAFEKEFAEREKNLKESEKELETLRQEAELFAEKLENAVQEAQTATEERIKMIHSFEKELREKDIHGQLNLKDQQIKTLEAKIKEMEIQLKEASSKVDTSEKTVKDIALKAIENSTKMQVLEREKRE
ncbi:MAG: hypothetical protein GX102_03960 [Porphyromonadaceae bacterium]|jgi:hypothetical protein|nr:hypothetical protein [Porphyromonadaceae bacterium]